MTPNLLEKKRKIENLVKMSIRWFLFYFIIFFFQLHQLLMKPRITYHWAEDSTLRHILPQVPTFQIRESQTCEYLLGIIQRMARALCLPLILWFGGEVGKYHLCRWVWMRWGMIKRKWQVREVFSKSTELEKHMIFS